jgi:hypothetical protein
VSARLALWSGILAAPLAWSAAFVASFSSLPAVCADGGRVPLLAMHAIAFGVAVVGGALARRESARDPFMARVGLGTSALFALLIGANVLAVGMIDPCLR